MLRALLAIALVTTACKKSESVEVTVTGTGSASAASEPPPAPIDTTRQRLEKSLKKNLSSYNFTTFKCPETPPTAETAECTASADNGVTITLKFTRTALNDNGSWKSWTSDPPSSTVITADRLAANLHDGVAAEVKKAHPKATFELACGSSPVLFKDHKAKCKLTLKNPDTVEDVDVDDSKGDFTWTTKL